MTFSTWKNLEQPSYSFGLGTYFLPGIVPKKKSSWWIHVVHPRLHCVVHQDSTLWGGHGSRQFSAPPTSSIWWVPDIEDQRNVFMSRGLCWNDWNLTRICTTLKSCNNDSFNHENPPKRNWIFQNVFLFPICLSTADEIPSALTDGRPCLPATAAAGAVGPLGFFFGR